MVEAEPAARSGNKAIRPLRSKSAEGRLFRGAAFEAPSIMYRAPWAGVPTLGTGAWRSLGSAATRNIGANRAAVQFLTGGPQSPQVAQRPAG